MSNKYFDGVVSNKGCKRACCDELIALTLETPKKVAEKMDKLRVADAITEIFTLFKRCNKYIDETMPWALAKEEDKKDRLATVLYQPYRKHLCRRYSSYIIYAINSTENFRTVKYN